MPQRSRSTVCSLAAFKHFASGGAIDAEKQQPVLTNNQTAPQLPRKNSAHAVNHIRDLSAMHKVI
jgi:hypothetical protein